MNRPVTANSKTIVFCLTARSGLGHLRRITTITNALNELSPASTLTLMTNAEPVGMPAHELKTFSKVYICARALMAQQLQQINPDVVVLDTICIPDIESVNAAKVLILRESPRTQLEKFHLPGRHRWDKIIVPNPPSHWSPELMSDHCIDLHHVGWIYRSAGLREHRTLSGLLIATGGGGSADIKLQLLVEGVLTQLQSIHGEELHIHQAIGALSHREPFSGVSNTIFPGGELHRYFSEADAVISTAGYNSILELATTDTPAVLIGIDRSIDDQFERARTWGSRLGRYLHQDNVYVVAQWLSDVLINRRRRAAIELGQSGEAAAARLITGLL